MAPSEALRLQREAPAWYRCHKVCLQQMLDDAHAVVAHGLGALWCVKQPHYWRVYIAQYGALQSNPGTAVPSRIR